LKLTQVDKRAGRFRKQALPRAPMLGKYQTKYIDPILEILHQNDYNETIKSSLKFLLITNVSIIEEVLLRLLAKTIDDSSITLSTFGNKIVKSYDPSKRRSIGLHTSSNYNFGSIEQIDDVFSKLLNTNNDFKSKNMTFLKAVEKSDSTNDYRIYKEYKTKPLYKNWNNFIEMFESRNKLIHGISYIKLSNGKIATLCDNTITFLDIAIALCMMNKDIFDLL
jgi:hypothetical protein